VELYRDLTCAVDLEDARCNVPVERELRIGIVVDEDDIQRAAACDDSLEIVERCNGGGRVVRIVEVDDARSAEHVVRDLVQLE
jgi:hypothetical protein